MADGHFRFFLQRGETPLHLAARNEQVSATKAPGTAEAEVHDTDEASVEDMPLPAAGRGRLPISEAPGGVEPGLDGDASHLAMQGAAVLAGAKKRHACPQCPKTFSTAGNRDRHVRTVHEGIKAHACPQCPKTFTTARGRDVHVRAVHEGKKPHVCPHELCGVAFAAAHHLKSHVVAVHEGKKPHVCPHEKCGVAFAHANSLKRHVEVVHKGIKEHACEKCHHRFARSVHLKRHLETCGRITSSQRAAISSNGSYAFRDREITEADRDAEQRAASAVGGEVPVLHRDASTEQKNAFNAQVDAIVQRVAGAIGDGPSPMNSTWPSGPTPGPTPPYMAVGAHLGSAGAEGLSIDPGTRSFPADDPRLVKCLTRRGSMGSPNYTSQNEKGEWVFAAREFPPPGAGYPVPAMIPIAVSFDPTSNTTVTEGRLVKLGHKGQGHLFLNPPNFNAGPGLKMAKFGSVLYLLPTTGNVGRAEVDELLGKLREQNNEASKEARKEKKATKRQQSSEDELSPSATLEGDS